MSDSEKPRRREKLPPLNINAAANETTMKRTKKKPVHNMENEEEDSHRAVPARPRARVRTNSRDRAEDSDGGSARREIPRRPRKPKANKSLEDDEGGQSEETGVDHPMENPSQRPKKKRKPKQPRADSQEALVGDGSATQDGTSMTESRPKKKRKRKPQVGAHVGPAAVGLEAELDDLDEDIIMTDNTDSLEDKWSTPAIRSQAINKLYIEQRSGFKSTNKAKVAQRRLEEQRRATAPPEPPRTKNTIQFAISSHRIFKTITLFLQGLLSGICLWQIVTVYMLSNQGYDILLQQYYKLALPVQCMYYFLLAISTVAVFDRNDVVRPTRRFVLRSVTMQSSAIACLFYLAGLVISLAVARTDDKIGLYAKQPELWEDTEARDSELKTWVILNLVRGILPILGWFVVSLRPQTDRLIKNLEQADENAIGEDDVGLAAGGTSGINNRDAVNVRGATEGGLRV